MPLNCNDTCETDNQSNGIKNMNFKKTRLVSVRIDNYFHFFFGEIFFYLFLNSVDILCWCIVVFVFLFVSNEHNCFLFFRGGLLENFVINRSLARQIDPSVCLSVYVIPIDIQKKHIL